MCINVAFTTNSSLRGTYGAFFFPFFVLVGCLLFKERSGAVLTFSLPKLLGHLLKKNGGCTFRKRMVQYFGCNLVLLFSLFLIIEFTDI